MEYIASKLNLSVSCSLTSCRQYNPISMEHNASLDQMFSDDQMTSDEVGQKSGDCDTSHERCG